ncbi:slightly ste11-like protein, partial [Marasmius crinis-equi]
MQVLRTHDTQAPSLEVTTDAPRTRRLAIISSTPRDFAFPPTYHLSDSPYSAPPLSPVEPDPHFIAASSAAFSPLHTPTPNSASPASHNRPKASTSSIASTSPSDVDCRPKTGDEGYIKRPENAFILFRRKCREERDALAASNGDKKQRQANPDLSKVISQRWRTLPEGEKKFWEDLAKEKKKEHEQLYPNYVYRPPWVREKSGNARSRKRAKNGTEGLSREESNFSISFVIPPPRAHSRSASAPTPPLLSQVNQLPSLSDAGFLQETYIPEASSPSWERLVVALRDDHGYYEDSEQEEDYLTALSGSDYRTPSPDSDYYTTWSDAVDLEEEVDSEPQPTTLCLLPVNIHEPIVEESSTPYMTPPSSPIPR